MLLSPMNVLDDNQLHELSSSDPKLSNDIPVPTPMLHAR